MKLIERRFIGQKPSRDGINRWVESPSVLLESSQLLALPPQFLLRVLRDHFGKEKAIAYFQSSQPSEGGFRPQLTLIGVDPVEIIQCKNGKNPFVVLQEKLSARKVSKNSALPFFQGGAMGYFSYDAVRFLEPKLLQIKDQSPHYDAEFAFFKYYFIFDHATKHAFVLSLEPGVGQKALQDLEQSVLEKCKTQNSISATLLASDLASDQVEIPTESMNSSLGKDTFLSGVVKLKHHIREGDIFQAVLSEKFSCKFNGDPLDLFSILSELSPAPYQFYFSLQDRAYFGASPEMLLKSSDGKIETHPIAGTRPRGANPQEEKKQENQLLSSVKEKAEHLMLVDLARNDIGRVADAGSVNVSSFMQLRKFGGVMHLVSTVTGKLNPQVNSVQALASCFPAGTLSGAPKMRAMDLITEIEEKPRGFYGGAFVAASLTGDLDSCISIRCISVEKGVANVQAGAGIVADSNPEKEYAEIQHKSKLTRKALAMAGARP